MATYDELYAHYVPQYTTRQTYQRGAANMPDWMREGTYTGFDNGTYYLDDFDRQGAVNAATNALAQQNYQAAAAANPAGVVPQAVKDYFGQANYSGDGMFNHDGRIWQALGANGGVYYGAGLANDTLDSYRTSTIAGDKIGKADQYDYEFKGDGTYNQTMLNEDPGGWAMFATAVAAALTMGIALPAAGAAGAAAEGGAAAAGAAGAEGAALGAAGADAAAMGAGGAGLGSTGTGLSLGGGGLGLTGTTGSGLALAGNAVAPGVMTAAAPGAGAIGAGIGTSGLAAGTGSLLGAAALDGTTTLSTGATLQNAGAAAGATPAAGAGGGGAGSGAATTGTPPPANPYATGAASGLGGLGSSGVGQAVTAVGGLLGSQGQSADTTTTRNLPGFLQAPVASDLVPRVQGLLASQMPQAQGVSNQLLTVGNGLLGQTAPTTATNPYLASVADDMQRRTQEVLGANNMQIQGNSVAAGGLGGSRQGVAQAGAASKAADSLQGNIAGLYGNAYNQDQNRLRQDWTIGSGLLSQGLSTPWAPIQGATQAYSPFTGFGQTSANQQSGGNLQGAIGGALGAAQFGSNMGWW